MSCLASAVDFRSTHPVDVVVRRMLAAGARRGADVTDVVGVAGRAAALGVGRFDWECAPGLSGGAEVIDDRGVVVAADATLYYVDDLLAKLAAASVRPSGVTPSHLVAAAYRAWGSECVSRLEGDFAFVVWDAANRTLFAARDFVGSRPLFHAMAGSTLVIASSVGAVLAHPGIVARPNVALLAEAVSGALTAGGETAFEGVSVMPAGHTLRFTGEMLAPSLERAWQPPVFAGEEASRVPFAEAAAELRSLLEGAVRERMLPSGPTAVTLSGGWDSTAVYAAGQSWLERVGRSRHDLAAVSMSFPVGDSGREDELIEQVLARWDTTTRWVHIADAPLLGGIAERAARRDDLFSHGFEENARLLARGSAATGARAVLNGYGGDQWFHAEPLFLADIVRSGRPVRAWREWQSIGGEGLRAMAPWALVPLLGARGRRLASRLRGRPVRGVLDPKLAPWVRPEFVRAYDVEGRMAEAAPSQTGVRGAAAFEKQWYLAHPYLPRITAETSDLSLEEGVEQRAPLMDERVIRFAATRPRSDRRLGNETKRLLRAAMAGLLPDAFLAPRPYRTGTMSDYFSTSLRDGIAELGSTVGADSPLSDLGVIDLNAYRRAVEACQRGDLTNATAVYATLQTDLWFRHRFGANSAQPRRSGTGT